MKLALLLLTLTVTHAQTDPMKVPVEADARMSMSGIVATDVTSCPSSTDYFMVTYWLSCPDGHGHYERTRIDGVRVKKNPLRTKPTSTRFILPDPIENRRNQVAGSRVEVQVEAFDALGARSHHVGGTTVVAK